MSAPSLPGGGVQCSDTRGAVWPFESCQPPGQLQRPGGGVSSGSGGRDAGAVPGVAWPGTRAQSPPTGHVLGSGLTATCPCHPGAPMDPHHLTWGFMGCTAGPACPARSWHFTHALNRMRGRSRGHKTLCGDLPACPQVLWSCPEPLRSTLPLFRGSSFPPPQRWEGPFYLLCGPSSGSVDTGRRERVASRVLDASF